MAGEVTLEGMTPEAVAELAHLSQRLATNPKTREGFLRLTKVANPELNIPEIELKEQIGGVLKAQRDKIGELEGKLTQRFQQEEMREAERKALRSAGYSEDDTEKVRQFMLDNKVADFASGVKLFKMSSEAAVPTPSASRGYGISLPADFKTISAAPNKWALNEAAKAMDDLIKARARA